MLLLAKKVTTLEYLKSNYSRINIDGINVSEKRKHWQLLNYVISPIIDIWSLQTSFLLYKYRFERIIFTRR